MKPIRTLLASVAVALLPLGASAATLVSYTFGDIIQNADITDTSVSGLIRLDLDYRYDNDSIVTLRYRIDAAEAAAGSLSLNAILRNNMSFDFWEAGVWQAPGSPVTIGNPAGSVWGGSTPVVSQYHGPSASGGCFDCDHALNGAFGEPDIAYLGNPLSQSGRTDFTLMLNGLPAGGEFEVIIAVPEPGEIAFLLAGLGAILARTRKRAKRSG
jgi:hypothetical protein